MATDPAVPPRTIGKTDAFMTRDGVQCSKLFSINNEVGVLLDLMKTRADARPTL